MKKVFVYALTVLLLFSMLAVDAGAYAVDLIFEVDSQTKKPTDEIDYEATVAQYLSLEFATAEEKLETMEMMMAELRAMFPDVALGYWQSNIEGEIVDRIQEVGFAADGLIVNAGGYSHTSVAIHDALKAVPAPAVEVHISNIFAREEYRRHSLLSEACVGVICGLGLQGYELAVRALLSRGGAQERR